MLRRRRPGRGRAHRTWLRRAAPQAPAFRRGRSEPAHGFCSPQATRDAGPRARRGRAPRIAVELGGVRERSSSPDALAVETRVVAERSGMSRRAVSHWTYGRRLRAAVACFAGNSRHAANRAARLHGHAGQRACGRPHAARVLARVWIEMPGQDGNLSDPTARTASKAFARYRPYWHGLPHRMARLTSCQAERL